MINICLNIKSTSVNTCSLVANLEVVDYGYLSSQRRLGSIVTLPIMDSGRSLC
ncbi:hypothetical protein [Aquimarina atlantica]|uniref:hypothetical protein n=1 Tax=Aquimarina atlantica TaxID=1317122 RepID=UPI0013F45F2C|nr:hypothetical protein [Aquimarina atlantica]